MKPVLKIRSLLLASIAFLLTATAAFAHPAQSGPHFRPSLFHDRTTHSHDHSTVAHH